MRFQGLLIGFILLSISIILGLSLLPIPAAASPSLATPTADRLAKPTLPATPSQADLGAVEYWFSCMVCHGYRGQGLTEEWRAASGPEDMNCWQSKCHASNHPPEGFVLPPFAPQVIGPGALGRFASAADLHGYISEEMPWQMPGLLDEQVYWQLTAFLLRENGVSLARSINPQNAQQVLLRENRPDQQPVETTQEYPEPALTPTVTSYLYNGETVGSEAPVWVLMLFFGCILLLASIGWPLILARRRLNQEAEDDDKFVQRY